MRRLGFRSTAGAGGLLMRRLLPVRALTFRAGDGLGLVAPRPRYPAMVTPLALERVVLHFDPIPHRTTPLSVKHALHNNPLIMESAVKDYVWQK